MIDAYSTLARTGLQSAVFAPDLIFVPRASEWVFLQEPSVQGRPIRNGEIGERFCENFANHAWSV